MIEKRNKVKVVIKHPFTHKQLVLEALETPNISNAVVCVPAKDIKTQCYKNKIHLADKSFRDKHLQLSLLIGSDYYWKVVTGKIQRLSGTLVACETILGWTVNGSSAMPNQMITQSSANVMKIAVDTIESNSDIESNLILRNFWELESLGIKNDVGAKERENEVLNKFNESICLKDNRYEVKLPFNERVEELEDNYEIAFNRMNSLTRKFRKNPEFHKRYQTIIEEYLEKGIAEEVTDNTEKRLYYLPHQGVLREDKVTTKLRVVFDASSHAKGVPSLNDCLFSGPNLNPDLLGILINFRMHKVAISADIEQAFTQILISKAERDAVRFLWIKGQIGEQKEYKILRMTRVIFGATSSPFLLAATLKHHAQRNKEEFPKISELIENRMYVDDLICGTDSEIEAIEIRRDMKTVMQKGSFNLRKWKTNSSCLQQKWDLEETAELKSSSGCCKILGYIWDNRNDLIRIPIPELNILDSNQEITKRMMLQIIGRVYDPIGLINPFTVTSKILMQECWRAGLEWDDPLPLDIQSQFKRWCEDLVNLNDIEIDRYYFGNASFSEISNIQLHCFCDSSMKAYGAVIYLRYITSNEIKTSFVISKSRVSPLKKMTLPRLELMGAVIGSRLTKYIMHKINCKIRECFYWTDSTIVLHWVKGDPHKWKQFVSNRVTEIQEITDPSSWNFCPGQENPADFQTRGCSAKDLVSNKRIWNGPQWLALSEEKWPKDKGNFKGENIDKEKKSDHIAVNYVSNDKIKNPMFDIEKISSLTRVFRITAWIKRFLNNLKLKKDDRIKDELTAEEIEDAEKTWIKYVQAEMFSSEINCIKGNRCLNKESSIKDLNPFIDNEEIIRVGGRLQKASFTFDEKHPVILPRKHKFTELVVWRAHEKLFHSGVAETLTQIRQRFWIVKAKQCIKATLNRCVICKRFSSRPGTQPMAPLPEFRIEQSHPFNATGLDFAGPLYIKNSDVKHYILLFTCAATRAVHLELVNSLTTENFLLAFRRFIARRGLCSVMYSDNAKTFKRAELDLKNIWKTINHPDVKKFYALHGITWRYIVEKAAWWGGFYERLIRSVKTALRKTIGKTSLTFDELETLLVETEAILNSRPITYIGTDAEELCALTPAHFLIGKRITCLPSVKLNLDTNFSSRKTLIKAHNYRERLMKSFWSRWKNEYLLNLRSAHLSLIKNNVPNFNVNDIVIIKDDFLPRNFWKLGKILELFPGRDGKVRACKVKTDTSVIKRPVQLLYNLEL
ncbi:uncharacterized protein [Parasteatoda tepidariorum]|uniref:uncharacterized protein n=1 Tax=Parasteatoda tepidariorum TaxID=114398 RepID=UPI001C724B6B|nr:uncharacterized protein LOC107453817 [Parasteatoda tepidariorum]